MHVFFTSTGFIFNLQIRAYFNPHANGYRKIAFGPVLIPLTSTVQKSHHVDRTLEWTLSLGNGEETSTKNSQLKFKPFRTSGGGGS